MNKCLFIVANHTFVVANSQKKNLENHTMIAMQTSLSKK